MRKPLGSSEHIFKREGDSSKISKFMRNISPLFFMSEFIYILFLRYNDYVLSTRYKEVISDDVRKNIYNILILLYFLKPFFAFLTDNVYFNINDILTFLSKKINDLYNFIQDAMYYCSRAVCKGKSIFLQIFLRKYMKDGISSSGSRYFKKRGLHSSNHYVDNFFEETLFLNDNLNAHRNTILNGGNGAINAKNTVNLLSQLGVLKKILFKESLFKILFLLILFNSSIDTKFSILQYGVQNYSWPHSLINYIPLVSQTAKLIGISIFQLYTNKMCYKNYAMITILKRYFLWNIILQMSKNVFIILLLSFLTTCASLLYYFNISLDSLNSMNAPYVSYSSLLYSNGKEDMYVKLKNSPKTHYFNINPFSKGVKGIASKKIVRFSEENAKTQKFKDEEKKNKRNAFKIASDYSSDSDQWLIIDNLKVAKKTKN
ncbi:hypothetical protein, conserved [Plasmodium ovale curtisi]|uniref:Uncharacterized protein n=1 Tax=Plasmodium ovale curtisi TaxID=864141 RepID=A0A1A8VP68_PLAOA|nr:hypothetical protein, conserved [Plasmodium ovale curtisi]SBS83946.1 hypothetical protein, conserved [Plasmodium ovale curtisi]